MALPSCEFHNRGPSHPCLDPGVFFILGFLAACRIYYNLRSRGVWKHGLTIYTLSSSSNTLNRRLSDCVFRSVRWPWPGPAWNICLRSGAKTIPLLGKGGFVSRRSYLILGGLPAPARLSPDVRAWGSRSPHTAHIFSRLSSSLFNQSAFRRLSVGLSLLPHFQGALLELSWPVILPLQFGYLSALGALLACPGLD